MKKYIILFILLLAMRVSAATTYYVASGATACSGSPCLDSNNGTAKTTAWAHAPGMQTCTSTCSSTTIHAGDSIILRGGDTWTNSNFSWSPPGGSSGTPTYIGVDKTWFAGGSWVRPILTAGGSVISNNTNRMIQIGNNTTFDNFEVTGYFWNTGNCSDPFGQCVMLYMSQDTGQTVENLYIHGWTHQGVDHGATAGIADIFAFGGGAPSIIIHDNIITGADVPGDHSVNAFFNGPGVAYNNVITQVSSAFIATYPNSIHDNLISDIGPSFCNTTAGTVTTSGHTVTWVSGSQFTTGSSWNGLNIMLNDLWGPYTISSVGSATSITTTQTLPTYSSAVPYNVFTNAGACSHENGFEDNADIGLNFYNNVITGVNQGLALWIAPNPSFTANIVNNVIYNVHDNQVLDVPAPPVYASSHCSSGPNGQGYCNFGGNIVLENNTVQCGDDNTQYINGCTSNLAPYGSSGSNTYLSENNHFIVLNLTGTGCGATSNCTFTSNTSQTQSTANGQGYNSSQTFAFSPTTGGSTIGAGTNLTSSWPSGISTNDTTYGCSDVSNVSSCPARITIPRPSSGSWDTGAYEFTNSIVHPPTLFYLW